MQVGKECSEFGYETWQFSVCFLKICHQRLSPGLCRNEVATGDPALAFLFGKGVWIGCEKAFALQDECIVVCLSGFVVLEEGIGGLLENVSYAKCLYHEHGHTIFFDTFHYVAPLVEHFASGLEHIGQSLKKGFEPLVVRMFRIYGVGIRHKFWLYLAMYFLPFLM